MPRQYAPTGYVIQAGDVIEAYIPSAEQGKVFWSRKDRVSRVTANFAFTRNNDVSETRYRRIVDHRFYALPYQRTNMQYRVIKAKDVRPRPETPAAR